MVLVQAARSTLLRYSRADYADSPLAAPVTSPIPRTRVVWIIFDELSQTIAFGNRPPDLRLLNLDRLRAESFYATSAVAPGNSTEVSMPALILGDVVVEVSPRGPKDLRLRTRSRPELFTWSSAPNVFDTARELGFNTALVGWYHPYGRILSRSLTRCYWTAGWLAPGVEELVERQPLAGAMRDRAKLQFAALPLIGHLPGVFAGNYQQRKDKERSFSHQLAWALEVVADPSIGLALIHLQIPHPPAIYSASTDMMTATGDLGYLDNVALADRTLGTLRGAMEQAGLWDRTALLISADHGWRTRIWRDTPDWTPADEAASRQDTSAVPFLLKLPGQASGVVYDKPFNTVVTRRIITDILDGKLTTLGSIPQLIDLADHR
jgi:hypothetical protein